MTNPRHPVFVISRPRCGSTLLRSVLSAHSQIQLVNEPDLIMAMRIKGYNVTDRFDRQRRGELLEKLRQHFGCRRHLQSLSARYVDAMLDDESVQTFQDVYQYLLPKPLSPDPLSPDPLQPVVWGDKCVGSSMFVVDDLLAMYPEALVIHITRDPRAVLLSTYQKRMAHAEDRLPPFCRESIAFFAYESMKWNAALAAFEASRERHGPAHIYELAFESFVSNPEHEIRRLLSRIGLPYEVEMLNPIRRRSDPVLQDDCAFAHQRLDQAIDSTRAAGGNRLPNWASFVIQRCAADSLPLTSYQLAERPTLMQRAVIQVGLRAFYPKLQQRLQREIAWAARDGSAAAATGMAAPRQDGARAGTAQTAAS